MGAYGALGVLLLTGLSTGVMHAAQTQEQKLGTAVEDFKGANSQVEDVLKITFGNVVDSYEVSENTILGAIGKVFDNNGEFDFGSLAYSDENNNAVMLSTYTNYREVTLKALEAEVAATEKALKLSWSPNLHWHARAMACDLEKTWKDYDIQLMNGLIPAIERIKNTLNSDDQKNKIDILIGAIRKDIVETEVHVGRLIKDLYTSASWSLAKVNSVRNAATITSNMVVGAGRTVGATGGAVCKAGYSKACDGCQWVRQNPGQWLYNRPRWMWYSVAGVAVLSMPVLYLIARRHRIKPLPRIMPMLGTGLGNTSSQSLLQGLSPNSSRLRLNV